MRSLVIVVSIFAFCFSNQESEAQRIKMPVHESLAAEFDQSRLDGRWIVTSVVSENREPDSKTSLNRGDALNFSADANIGLSQISGAGVILQRPAGSTYMKKIDAHALPKRIDVVVELEGVVAHFYDEVLPQEKQLKGQEMKVLNGIYRIEIDGSGNDVLTWCFSKYGVDHPNEFEADVGRGITLVTLQRPEKTDNDQWASSIVSDNFRVFHGN